MKLLPDRRSKNKIFAGLAVLVLLVFLLIYSDTGSPPALIQTEQSQRISEFYLVNARSQQYDELGSLDTTIHSTHLKHNPSDDSVSINTPLIDLYKQGLPQWQVSAQSGIVYDQGNKIDLQQRVVIISSDETSSLKTPQLFIYPRKKQANTEQAVTLLNANGFTRAIGLQADLAKQSIVLLDQVRGQYEPTATLSPNGTQQ